jgi:putative transcriptional regulator
VGANKKRPPAQNRRRDMPFKYDKMFVLLKEKGITTYKIRKYNLISQAALTKMKNGGGNIDTRTLERVCSVLDCQPGDIMKYVEDESV